MNYQKVFLSIIIILILQYIYQEWRVKDKEKQDLANYDLVNYYLLDENSLKKINKPILWIHISYNINSRKWKNFYSRNSQDLNQDYLYLTIKSIINKCGEYFHICLIDDKSFYKLLPQWNVDLVSTPYPLREHLRSLALSNVLYKYGGFLVPPSFIAFKCLSEEYENLDDNTILVGELLNRSMSSFKYFPNSKFMACRKECSNMRNYILYLENLNSTNFSDSISVENSINIWFKNNNNIKIISSSRLGVEDIYGDVVNIDRLIGNTYININPEALGIYIPDNELLTRTAYNWFTYLSSYDVLESNTQIGKYILISQ